MANLAAQFQSDLEAIDAQLTKVRGELDLALNPPAVTFVVTGLLGVFADDTGVVVGDRCTVRVLRGRIRQLGTDGIWNGIDPGTVAEYTITSKANGVVSTPALEGFYAG